ncbi:MAG TPA: FHA domain-containing protein [Pirellulaceae bacterium]|nr:FHA domain-containing protein [Pirellulaceae bacterium]
MVEASPSDSEIVIQLLDPTQGGVLKSWKFQERESISIGRASERDVEVVDAYVSRLHAVLERRDGQWVLVSQGRNGVYVEQRPVQELKIPREVTFRLGASGPLLAFRTTTARDENLATLTLDTLPASLFSVDEVRLEAEVGAIVDQDAFLRLQQQAQNLRRQRASR